MRVCMCVHSVVLCVCMCSVVLCILLWCFVSCVLLRCGVVCVCECACTHVSLSVNACTVCLYVSVRMQHCLCVSSIIVKRPAHAQDGVPNKSPLLP